MLVLVLKSQTPTILMFRLGVVTKPSAADGAASYASWGASAATNAPTNAYRDILPDGTAAPPPPVRRRSVTPSLLHFPFGESALSMTLIVGELQLKCVH
jgi:hypothetical protein